MAVVNHLFCYMVYAYSINNNEIHGFFFKWYTWVLMSTHASVLVDSVGPPSAEVCRTAASFP
jgi:hypothetical protein